LAASICGAFSHNLVSETISANSLKFYDISQNTSPVFVTSDSPFVNSDGGTTFDGSTNFLVSTFFHLFTFLYSSITGCHSAMSNISTNIPFMTFIDPSAFINFDGSQAVSANFSGGFPIFAVTFPFESTLFNSFPA
jgi:hypothetical protein